VVNLDTVEQSLVREPDSREHWALLVGDVGVVEIDLRSGEMYIAPALKRMLGYNDHEIRNHVDDWVKLVHPDYAAESMRRLEAHMRGETPRYEFEHQMIRKDGTAMWVLCRGAVLRDASGKATRFIGVDAPIDSMKAAQARAVASDQLARQLAETMPALVYVFDFETGFIVYHNSEFSTVFGVPDDPSFPLDAAWMDRAVHPEDREKVARKFDSMIRDGSRSVVDMTIRILNVQGEYRWVACRDSIVQRGAAGEALRAVGVAVDVTEQRRAQEQLAVAELKRVRAEQEKFAATGRMAARVAHEINNPLAGVKNALRLMAQAIPVDHPYRELSVRIDRELDRIGGIVKSMYCLDRPGRVKAMPIDVEELLADVLLFVQPMLDSRRVSIDRQGDNTHFRVMAVDGALRQAILNVLQNAIEASRTGATVELQVYVVGDKAMLSVRDFGAGIPATAQPHIFEPFYTTKSTPVEGGNGGMGLGLAVAKTLMNSMNGDVTFESHEGKGTTFYLSMPLEQASSGGGKSHD
jgi:two-component system, sporulation sensor kinase C